MMVIRKRYFLTCLSALILTSCSGGGHDTFLYKNYTVADGSATAGDGHNILFKGSPLSLSGNGIKVGDQLRSVKLAQPDNSLINLTDTAGKGKVRIISVVPSLDTAVCAMQTKKFNDQLATLGDKVNALTVSMDLPFAMNRFCGAESIKNMRVGSDYQDRTFGTNWGTLIEELKIECRAVFVLDAAGKVKHAEYVGEVTNEPDYHAAMEALQSAL